MVHWDMEWDNFLPFYLPNNSQNQNFEKMKKTSWRCHHVIILHVFQNHNYMMHASWDMDHDKHFFWRYYPFTYAYHKWRSYDILSLRYKVIQTEFFVILGHFLPFELPNNLEKQNFEKIKKKPGYIITLHLCTTNDIMIYASWDMECNRLNVFFILDHFLPFYPPSNSKIEILKKWKKNPWHIIVLRQCNKTHGHMIICYTVPEIWCVTDAIFNFILGYFLPFVL